MTRAQILTLMAITAAGLLALPPGARAQAEAHPPVRPIRLAAGQVDPARATLRLDRDQVGATERVLLQFDHPLTDFQRRQLADAGVALLDYLGDGSFAARLRPGLRTLPHARWIGRLDPATRQAPALNAGQFRTQQRRDMAQADTAAVVITLFADASAEEIADVVRAVQAAQGSRVYAREVVGGNITITAEMPVAPAKALASMPSVQFIEDAPEIIERNSGSRGVVQSDSPGFTPLYSAGLTGLGQIVGVADSRVDFNQCAFFDTVAPGPTHRKLLAYNSTSFVFATHGTHVAGSAVGDAGAFDENRGVAFGAKFVYSPTPAFNEESALGVFNLHHSQGARVHTNSWGNDATTQYDSLCRGIDAFMYANEDDLVLFAVTNGTQLKNPENCKNALAVGACQDAPAQNSFCSGGVGPTADGRRKPEVFAPGCSIQSAQVNTLCSTIPLTGTSMACPAVAGVATLMRQYFVDGYYPSGAAIPSDGFTPSGALLKAMVLNSTADMLSYGSTIPNSSEGWGRVVADSSVFLAGDSRRLFVRDVRNAGGMGTGGIVEIPLQVNSASEPLRVTLAWTEPPAAAGTAAPSTNNLDLEVMAPDATIYRGNVFSAGFSATGGAADTLNNVEQVFLNSPAVGVWTLRVKATAVNVGLQGFALVANADLSVPARPLTTAINPPVPSVVPGNTHAQFTVTIDPGDDTLTPGSARLLWRKNAAAAFAASPLFPLGGTQYRATLPRFACSDSPQFYIEAAGSATGTVTAPLGGPGAAPISLTVGVVTDTVLFSEGFESGLPGDWSATGLWHVTSACPQSGPCDPTSWAYFGGDSICTYGVTAQRQQGRLTMPSVVLPSLTPGASITLHYCMYLVRESAPTFDLARVLANGSTVIDQPTGPSTVWSTRTASLDALAGTTPSIAFDFDTIDGFANNFLGWQVDRVEVVHTSIPCTTSAPCYADINHDGAVNTQDLTMFLGRFGMNAEAFSPGDLNGDGTVNTADLTSFLGGFGVPCP